MPINRRAACPWECLMGPPIGGAAHSPAGGHHTITMATLETDSQLNSSKSQAVSSGSHSSSSGDGRCN
jgi:hypothetical protein